MIIKRLFWDCETSPNIGLFWRSGSKQYIGPDNIIQERSLICIGWKPEGKAKATVLTWDMFKNDRSMLVQFLKVANESDELVAHCVTQDTKILTSDLRYVNAGEIKTGDSIVGFDENISGRGRRRRFKPATVERSVPVEKPCLNISLSDGTSVKCSTEHPFLVPNTGGNDANWHWATAGSLAIGDCLTRVLPFFSEKNSYESGYLAGIFDGEGSISGQKDRLDRTGTIRVAFAQKAGITLDKTVALCQAMGYPVSSLIDNSNHLGGPVYRFYICGKAQAIKFLGEIRPERLIKNVNIGLLGSLHVFRDGRTSIVKIQDIGNQTVQEITTSTKTFISEGLPSHNCGDKFDMPWFRTRCLFHGLQPLPNYKTIDTYAWAKRLFLFNSNKLDYIAQYLDIGRKADTNFGLWKKVLMDNDREALAYMAKYCKQDLYLLEKVWERLRSVATPKTHAGVTAGRAKWTCAHCGDGNVKPHKRRITAMGTIQHQFQCVKCGGYYTVSHPTYLLYQKAKS